MKSHTTTPKNRKATTLGIITVLTINAYILFITLHQLTGYQAGIIAIIFSTPFFVSAAIMFSKPDPEASKLTREELYPGKEWEKFFKEFYSK